MLGMTENAGRRRRLYKKGGRKSPYFACLEEQRKLLRGLGGGNLGAGTKDGV